MEGKKTYEPVSMEVIDLKLASAIVGGSPGGGDGTLPETPNEDDNE